jgi:hypothetical protein
MGALRGADAERERTQAAIGAGMAVAADQGQARQHEAQFRRRHVDNALAVFAEIKETDVGLAGQRLQGGVQSPAQGKGLPGPPRRRGHRVI